jgi:hypothetical protein
LIDLEELQVSPAPTRKSAAGAEADHRDAAVRPCARTAEIARIDAAILDNM